MGRNRFSFRQIQPKYTGRQQIGRNTPNREANKLEFVAMVLAREEGVAECSNEREILDTYAILALPGTPVEKYTERSWTSTTTGNYSILREICLGRFSGAETKE